MPFEYVVGEGLKVTNTKQAFTFSINGVVELPNLTVIASPRHVANAFNILTAKVTAKVGGTASYRFVVKSYDSAGLNEVTHIDTTTVLGIKTITNLTVATSAVGVNRSLELSISTTTGTFAEDLTITIGE